jgi:uncharacterized protein
MRWKGIFSCFVFISLFLFPIAIFAAYVSPGAPQGFVNDFAGALSSQAKSDLERNIYAFSKETGHEISLVSIQTLKDEPIEDYANTLFREWGIGKKDVNNGVLFLVVIQDRKMRIEVGYGLEGALTDIESKHIQEDIVKPFFKEGKYEEGMRVGVEKIKEAIQGEVLPQASGGIKNAKKNNIDAEMLFYLVFIFFGVVVPWLASVFGRTKSWWAGGVAGGVIGAIAGFFTGWWIWILFSGIIGLVFDYVVSKNYKKHPNHPSWWAGGPWIGGGMGGFGGGGFGGFGGGSSGGGGSSSSW